MSTHHPQPCLLCRQTAGGPVRVQWCPSDKPKPVFRMTSWRRRYSHWSVPLSHVILGFLGTGMMVERLKQEGLHQLQWSVEDLCEDGGQLVSTGFQTDWWHTVWAWCLSLVLSEDLAHIIFTDLECRCGGDGGCWKCLWCFQTCNRTHSDRACCWFSTALGDGVL